MTRYAYYTTPPWLILLASPRASPRTQRLHASGVTLARAMPRRRVKASDWAIDEEAEGEEGLAEDATARKDVAREETFEAYDPSEALGSSSDYVPPARKRQVPTIFSDVDVPSVLAGLYGDEEPVPDVPDASGYRFQRDPTNASVEPESASVFTNAEKADSAARREDAHRNEHIAIDAPTKPPQHPDLGDVDASAWIPHVFHSGTGGRSVAWFRSREHMTPEERAAEDAAADRAEGIVTVPSEPKDEDVRERVERVHVTLDRPRGVTPAGRRAPPVGGVTAPRGIPHEPPHLRGKNAVVTRPTVSHRDGETVETMEETADADGRSPIIQKTTVVETTTRTVMMDERGNVIDESETREVRGDDAETTPAEKLLLTDAQLELVARRLRENHGVEVEPREIAELLDRLRTKRKYAGVHSAREDEDDDADRVGRGGDDATTNAATRGARSDSDSVGSGRDEDILMLIGKLAAGVFATEEENEEEENDDSGEREGTDAGTDAATAPASTPAQSSPRPLISPNVVYDRRLKPRRRGGIGSALGAGAVGVYERVAAPRGMSRGAWRTVRRADDPVPPQNAGRSAAASTPLDPSDRRRIVDAELRARVENTPRLKALSAKQRWTVAGAMTGFLTDTLAAARVAAEYRAAEEEDRRGAGWGWSRPKRTVIKQRRKLVDKDGNVVEEREETIEKDAEVKARAAEEISAAKKKCTCYKQERPPIVSGGIGARGKHRRPHRMGLGAVRHCPVHFPFAPTEETRPAPRAPPKKTHAVTGDRGGGAVQSSRDDDAGQTPPSPSNGPRRRTFCAVAPLKTTTEDVFRDRPPE